jgi:hypothetical protein
MLEILAFFCARFLINYANFNFLLVKFTLHNYNIAYEVVEFSRYKLSHILHYHHLGNPSFDIRDYHLCHR